MALSVFKGSFAKSTGGAPASQSVTGVGFQPKTLLMWATNQTAEGIQTLNTGQLNLFSIGFSDGTNHGSFGGYSARSLTQFLANRRHANKALQFYTLAECDVTSFDTDGFTLNWTTNDANAYIIHYLALGGSDITNVKVGNFQMNTVTGDQAITGVGFKPDLLFVLSGHLSVAPPANASHMMTAFGFGLAGEENSDVKNSHYGSVVHSQQIVNISNTTRRMTMSTPRAICEFMTTTGAADGRARLKSFDSDGFTLGVATAPSAAFYVFYLAIKGGRYWTFDDSQPTVTGTQALTGSGFTPKGILICHIGSNGDADIDYHFTMGASNGTNEGNCGWSLTDAINDSTHQTRTSTTAKVTQKIGGNAGTVKAEADLLSLDSDGFTLDWTTVDSNPGRYAFLGFGDKVVSKIYQVNQTINRANTY